MAIRSSAVVFASVFACAWAGSPEKLPEVESVLTKATDKMQSFAAQASAMQARVAEKQKESRNALEAQKAKFEGELAAQLQQNNDVSAANNQIRGQISALETGNAALVKETSKLRQDNKAMHDTLSAVSTKVDAANLFLADSLRVTDDGDAADLKVLEPPKPEPTLDHFLTVAKSDVIDVPEKAVSLAEMRGKMLGESFLQLSSARNKRDEPKADDKPEDFVQMLSQSLADIATAEKEGVAQLDAHFRLAFEQGETEHTKLLTVQQELNETRAKLQGHQSELNVAKTHLKATGDQLRQRLHGLRIFARKVDDAAGDALKALKHAPPAESSSDTTAGSDTTVQAKNVSPKPPAESLKRDLAAAENVGKPANGKLHRGAKKTSLLQKGYSLSPRKH